MTLACMHRVSGKLPRSTGKVAAGVQHQELRACMRISTNTLHEAQHWGRAIFRGSYLLFQRSGSQDTSNKAI